MTFIVFQQLFRMKLIILEKRVFCAANELLRVRGYKEPIIGARRAELEGTEAQ